MVYGEETCSRAHKRRMEEDHGKTICKNHSMRTGYFNDKYESVERKQLEADT